MLLILEKLSDPALINATNAALQTSVSETCVYAETVLSESMRLK